MGLANEQRQGMLQASSSWLTCIWHNVPCADRCRVAVWSSGFHHCKRIRHDWCSGKADSMNYRGLIRACREWFILLQNMVIHHICLHSNMVRVHIVFCSFECLMCIIFIALVRNFRGSRNMTLLNLRSLLCMPSKMAQKRTRYALWKLAVAAKVLKNVSCFSLDRCIAWHGGIELGSACGCRVIYWGCVCSILAPRAVSIVFQYPLDGAP